MKNGKSMGKSMSGYKMPMKPMMAKREMGKMPNMKMSSGMKKEMGKMMK